jgi:hypothetical protein
VAALHVSDATERTMQLRGIMSSASSGSAWDLRCDVREKLIAWLLMHYPAALPKMRMDVEGSGSP